MAQVQCLMLVCLALLYGCVAHQSDLKKAEKDLQQQLSQARARQIQEIATLREHELPQLRGELERALHQARVLQAKQEECKIAVDRFAKLNEVEITTIPQRLDSLDLVIGKILLRVEEIEKRIQSKEKR